MQGTVNIELVGSSFVANPKRSGLKNGPLVLPDGVSVDGGLIAFGENDSYLHCVTGGGAYYGVFKGDDDDHLYQHLLRLNVGCEA